MRSGCAREDQDLGHDSYRRAGPWPPERPYRRLSRKHSVTLLPKVQIEVVVADNVVEEVIQTVIKAARTGEIGDGRVFVLPVDQGYNIRTGEWTSDPGTASGQR